MKTILISIILGTGLAVTQVHAQNCYNPNYVPGCIKRGQVVCAAPVSCATPCDVAPSTYYSSGCYPRPSSSVVYIGSPQASARNYYTGSYRPCSSSVQVIHFGREQACRQGYQFSLPR